MSRYKRGLETAFEKPSDHVGGPWIATPGYIQDEIARLHGEMSAFNADLIKSLKGSYQQWLSYQSTDTIAEILKRHPYIKDVEDLRDRFGVLGDYPEGPLYNFYQYYSSTWMEIYKGWLAFYKAHQTWRSNWWGSVISSVEAWRRQLVGVRDLVSQFENIELDNGVDAGMVITSPDPVKGDDWEGSNLFKGVGGLLKTIVIGGAVIIGGVFGIKLLQGGSRALPSLPAASASERPARKTKADDQADRVADAIRRKTKS